MNRETGLRIQDSGSDGASGCCQRGFSLISAIFLLVVISALGMFAVTLVAGQRQGATMEMLGSRAYQAARAGVEWGVYQILTPGSISCNTYASPANNNVALTAPDLQNFTVTVACGSLAVSEAGATVTIYQLTSTATRGSAGSPTYIERQVAATVAQ